MKKLILTVILFGLFIGCAKDKSPSYTNPEFEGAPKWIFSPKVEGAIADIGIAKPNAGDDFSFQRQEAMADARDNLARDISIKVKNMFKTFKSTTGIKQDATYDKATETVSKQVANLTLNNTKIKDTWMSKSGTLYVLMYVSEKDVLNSVEKTIKSSFKNDKALYQQFLLYKKTQELDNIK